YLGAAAAAAAMPPTPPPTSSSSSFQHHHAAARQLECNNRIMASPELRRAPTPSTSHSQQSSRVPSTYNGQTYHHLPPHLSAQLAALPPLQQHQVNNPHSSNFASALAPAPVCFILLFLSKYLC